MKKKHGFTLVELMVVLAVTGIMLGFGVPKISRMLQANRVVASLNSLSAHLNYARSEAIKRSTSVSVVALDRKLPEQWELGWMVFVDPNADGNLDAPGEQQLRIVDALNIPNLTIRPLVGQNNITFDRFGAAAANNFTFLEAGYTPGKTLSISPTGHVSIP